MRIAIDSNVLLYAEGVNDPERMVAARRILARIPRTQGIVPVQALGECFRLLVRKGGLTAAAAADTILQWSQLYEPQETSVEAFADALDIASRHRLQIWDSVILAAASEAKCTILLSEDMQDGFRWRDTTVVNPFAKAESPLLSAALDPA